LLPGDAEVVARDPEVVALPTVLDDQRLTTYLRARWAGGAAGVPDAVRVTYLRYKPGTLLVAAVEVVAGGSRDVRLLVATAVAAQAKLDKLRAYAARRELPVLAADDHLRLVLLPIEADRHLPGLHRLDDRVGWIHRDLRGGQLRVLAYKPHRRLVAGVEVADVPAAVVKVHQPRAAGAPLEALAWASQVATDRIPLPRLLGAHPDTGLAMTEWLPGVALHQQEPDRRRATLRAVGKALGRLHQLDATGLPGSPVPDRTKVVAAAAHLRPDLATIAGRVHHPVTGCLVTPVHGDLSPDQVVHGDAGIALLDLDRMGRGCPAVDLASWIAATVVDAPHEPAVPQLPEPLLQGYRSVDGPATIDHVLEHLPFELLRRATDPFRSRRAGWSQTMTRIVRLADGAWVGSSVA
jgi:Ser/Thr protein kinase RdoA (MazF antagonist)